MIPMGLLCGFIYVRSLEPGLAISKHERVSYQIIPMTSRTPLPLAWSGSVLLEPVPRPLLEGHLLSLSSLCDPRASPRCMWLRLQREMEKSCYFIVEDSFSFLDFCSLTPGWGRQCFIPKASHYVFPKEKISSLPPHPPTPTPGTIDNDPSCVHDTERAWSVGF